MELALTPAGHLVVTPGVGNDTASFSTAGQKRLAKAFAAAVGDGLFRLLAIRADEPLPSTFSFWREFASHYVAELCHTPESAGGASREGENEHQETHQEENEEGTRGDSEHQK